MNDCIRKPRLLLVEDNRGDTFLIKEMLRDTGIELNITVAEDGQKALEILDRANGNTERPIDFVILDLNLPKVNGFEVLSYMKRMHGMRDIPVVVMTGSLNKDDRIKATSMGATNFLIKPSSNSEFEAIVDWMKGTLIGLDRTSAEKCPPGVNELKACPGDRSVPYRGSSRPTDRSDVNDRTSNPNGRFGPF
ncbi:MAG TPA: response regulator [Methanomassiliicoccales archaeon]|jgi:CheY-like chemotaxis protein